MSWTRLVWLVGGVLLLGACSSRTVCELSTCDGCCSAGGTCVAGNANDACGQASALCVACLDGQSCREGACVADEVDAGVPDAGTAGSLWVVGTLIDSSRVDVLRVRARDGDIEHFQVTRADGGVARFDSFVPSEDGRSFLAVMALEDPERFDLYVGDVARTALRKLVEGDGGVLGVVDVGEGVATWFEGGSLNLFSRALDGGPTIRATPTPWVLAAGSNLFVDVTPDRRYVSVVAQLAGEEGTCRAWVTDLRAPAPEPVSIVSAAQVGAPAQDTLGPQGYALITAGGRVVFKARLTNESALPGAPDAGVSYLLLSARVDGSDLRVHPNTAEGAEQIGTFGLSEDRTRLAFARSEGGRGYEVYVTDAEGSSAPVRVSSGSHSLGPYFLQPLVFSPDGRFLAFTALWSTVNFDPWVVSTSGDLEVRLFAMPQDTHVRGRLVWSPDSREVAFRSDHLRALQDEAFRVMATLPDQVPTRVFPLSPDTGTVTSLWWTRQ